MSTLTRNERRYLEKMLEMGDGYVLNYSDATFGEFFRRHGVEIHAERFQTYGTSKAKKMRSFGTRSQMHGLRPCLETCLDDYEVDCDLEGGQVDASLLEKSRNILARISGQETRVDPEEARTFSGTGILRYRVFASCRLKIQSSRSWKAA